MVEICVQHSLTYMHCSRIKRLCIFLLTIVLIVVFEYAIMNIRMVPSMPALSMSLKNTKTQTKPTMSHDNGGTLIGISKVMMKLSNTTTRPAPGMLYNLTQVTTRRPDSTPNIQRRSTYDLEFVKTKDLARHLSTRNYHKRHFITINLMGRLGNNMFQLAALMSSAKRLNYTAFVRPKNVLNYFFLSPITSDITLTNRKTFSERMYAKYDSNIERLDTNYNWTLFGYYQSWKYFYKDENLIRRSFEFSTNVSKAASQFVDGFRDKHKTIVGIHVRRGDFKTQEKEMIGYTTAPLSYIQKSMNYFRDRYNDTFFVICSDDITWCKNNIRGNNDTVFSSFDNPGSVMAMLSFCDHVIITSGTFGWWGAWLAGGEVVYFKGFPRPGSVIDKGMCRDDYYPPQWIGMD
ncbi:hypothetical protein ACJMK2_039057 [Sinanodonta woodiana]|uniref:L-Fucosyltransferase n=1 Tax=Sinanodonta woodiana TaxID=1069815 RepID=A0ABD3WE61_SINWO